MLTEKAVVVEVNDGHVVVEAAIKSTCNACQANNDCGTGVVSRALAPRTQQLKISTPLTLKIGQQVNVGIPESSFLTASFLLYLVPILTLVLSILAFNSLFLSIGLEQELLTLVCSVLAMWISFVVVSKVVSSTKKNNHQPVILISNAP